MFSAATFTESKRKSTAENSLSVDNHWRGQKAIVKLQELAGLRSEQDCPGSQMAPVRNFSRVVQNVQEPLEPLGKASFPTPLPLSAFFHT